MQSRPLSVCVFLALCSCGWVDGEREEAAAAARAATLSEVESVLARTVESADRAAGAADRILGPMPVMTPAEEEALRRFQNEVHVARARALAPRVVTEEQRDSLVGAGRLVQLEDSTRHWIVRGDVSPAYVVPDVRTLLALLAERFQDRLAELSLPAYRLEITSALRTAEGQERLRDTNANAAAGVSSHEFGTTVDVSYASFAPPAEPQVTLPADAPAGLRPTLERIVDLSFESVSAQKSRELGAIFSEVLAEAQAEGIALVIYERQQTVYHLTVGRSLAGADEAR